MRIRDKFTAILGIVFLNVIVIVGLSLFAIGELKRYQITAERGTALISRSRTVFNLMKDLAIVAFAPDTYSRLKDVFYFEKFETTLRNWQSAVGDFRLAFHDFMSDPVIRQMARSDSLVNDEFATASTMSDKAFGRLDSLLAGFAKLAASGFLAQDDSYQRIVSSDDQQIAGLFSEVRVTSYYLSNNFESFMNHFVNAVNERTAVTSAAITWSFLVITLLSAGISLALSAVFGNRIIRNVRTIHQGMADISRGDFSRRINVQSQDELGELARDINGLAGELKSRIDRLLHVTRDIGSGIDAETDLAAIRGIIVATTARETGAGGVAFIPRPGSVMGDQARLTSGLLDAESNLASLDHLLGSDVFHPGGAARYQVLDDQSGDEPFSSIMACPLPPSTGNLGCLVALSARNAPPFTDLDFIILQSYADFAALSIENYLKYRQLIELREAEYQSLQARIQPHFLFNVMNGLVGLNRMGEKSAVEAAVLDLKDLLRYTLDHDRTVGLADELSFVGKYLDLQKLRFGDRFDYSVDCDPACGTLPIPKLLLQPLAENALIHGIEPLPRHGRLEIRAEPVPDGVLVHIRDDGEGFDPLTRDATSRIGLSNVIKRLELAYPGSRFRIMSQPGQGCTVEIMFKLAGGQR